MKLLRHRQDTVCWDLRMTVCKTYTRASRAHNQKSRPSVLIFNHKYEGTMTEPLRECLPHLMAGVILPSLRKCAAAAAGPAGSCVAMGTEYNASRGRPNGAQFRPSQRGLGGRSETRLLFWTSAGGSPCCPYLRIRPPHSSEIHAI
jgi:hypothetical protein